MSQQPLFDTPDSFQELPELIERTGLTFAELGSRLGHHSSTMRRWYHRQVQPSQAEFRQLAQLVRDLQDAAPRPPRQPWFRFIDLFAGIGGLRRGLESIGGECVFTSERDENARRTYRANFGPEPIHPDVRTIDTDALPQFDVLAAGFPCQPFSIAGVTKKNALGRPHGFDDTDQGNLFFEIQRIIKARQPAMILLENVKNLKSHDGGRTFATIARIIDQDLGYTLSDQVIDGAHWVPQHRERIFLVAFRDPQLHARLDTMLLPSFPRPRLADILHGWADDIVPDSRYVLTPHLWEYLQNYAARHRAAGNGFGYGLVGPDDITRTLSARYYKDGSEILVQDQRFPRPRRLTPVECSRLMGFAEAGGTPWNIPVSDTQAYRQFGNAVIVPAVTAVCHHIRPALAAAVRHPLQQELPLVG